MIAIVIIRFVAILREELSVKYSSNHMVQPRNLKSGGLKGAVPTGHAPQSLDTRINISLTLLEIIASMLNRLPLPVQIGQHVPPNIFRLQRRPLGAL